MNIGQQIIERNNAPTIKRVQFNTFGFSYVLGYAARIGRAFLNVFSRKIEKSYRIVFAELRLFIILFSLGVFPFNQYNINIYETI